MSEEYGSDYITISDDEGNEFELEHLDTLEYNDELYMSFLPSDLDEDEDSPEMIILKVIEENGEEIFSTLDSEEELQTVYEKFMEHLFDDADGIDPKSDVRFMPEKGAMPKNPEEYYSKDYMIDGDSSPDSEDYLVEGSGNPETYQYLAANESSPETDEYMLSGNRSEIN